MSQANPTSSIPENDAEAPVKPSFLDAVKSVHLQDFKHLHQTPCARPAFLSGIASGFMLAGLQLVLGASIPKASSWALGSFIGVSVAVYEGCQAQREREKARVRLIQEVLDRKAKEKAREYLMREKARQMAQEAKENEEKLERDKAKWFWQP